jgi:hypothetical protein
MYPAEALMEGMEAEAGMFLSAPTRTFQPSLITDTKGNTMLAQERQAAAPT